MLRVLSGGTDRKPYNDGEDSGKEGHNGQGCRRKSKKKILHRAYFGIVSQHAVVVVQERDASQEAARR